MLRARRGAVLVLVLGTASVVLALISWGAVRVAWSRRQTRADWDRVVLDFAMVEVERAARGAMVPSAPEGATISMVTTNRLLGRLELHESAPSIWRVRWGVGGTGGLWREGGWLAVEDVSSVPTTGVRRLALPPALPLDR
jgi:hypothetical protein